MCEYVVYLRIHRFICERIVRLVNTSLHLWIHCFTCECIITYVNESLNLWIYQYLCEHIVHQWIHRKSMNTSYICEYIVKYVNTSYICEYIVSSVNPSLHLWIHPYICEYVISYVNASLHLSLNTSLHLWIHRCICECNVLNTSLWIHHCEFIIVNPSANTSRVSFSPMAAGDQSSCRPTWRLRNWPPTLGSSSPLTTHPRIIFAIDHPP
jgi:hypothetical protein